MDFHCFTVPLATHYILLKITKSMSKIWPINEEPFSNYTIIIFSTLSLPISSRLEMKFCLSNLKVAAKSRAARCVRLHDIIKNPWIHFGLLVTVLAFFTDAKEVATNTFYVKIHHDPNEPDLAHKIARRTGFHNLGPVSTI